MSALTGERARRQRTRRGWSLDEMARVVGLPADHVADVEAGRRWYPPALQARAETALTSLRPDEVALRVVSTPEGPQLIVDRVCGRRGDAVWAALEWEDAEGCRFRVPLRT